MEFHTFADAVNAQFKQLETTDLYRVNLSKDEIWNAYLDAYPAGSNELYIERTEHDCQTCRQFIKVIGNVVTINEDNTLTSVWDVDGLEYPYDIVAAKLSALVKSKDINSIFLHNEPQAGKQSNVQLKEDGTTITWNHFYAAIPNKFYERDIATTYSKTNARAQVHLRSLNEITLDSLDTVLELVDEGNIYRGSEFRNALSSFRNMKQQFDASSSGTTYAWKTYKNKGAGIRGSVIGTLLVDLSEGKDLEESVVSFGKKMDPNNYKRPTTLVTQSMINSAIAKIDELGIRDSLERRQAIPTDVSINDIIFADRTVGLKDKDPLAALLQPAKSESSEIKGLDKAPEISINDFLSQVVPTAKTIQLVTSGRHAANKVQISAPVNIDAPNILQWDNNFSWSYTGNVADSDMKQRVKDFGGKVDGDLRMSLQWNEEGRDLNNDLDAHCKTPTGLIYYGNKRVGSGTLDVDIRRPGSNTAVENITWPSRHDMPNGKYVLMINNFSGTNTKGFRAEIEFDGELYSYDYPDSMYNKQTIDVATVTLKDGKFSISHHLPHSRTHNQEFVPIKMIMLSPNHWGENNSGNKHFMFITDEEQDTQPFRGFYNEFLSPKLHEHRKVFDMLSSKMMCQPTEGGLSGYGFSETKREEIHCKVDNKIYLLKF